MRLESLTPEQISTLVRQAFPNVDVVSSERVLSEHAHLHYHLQLSNLMDTTLKAYTDAVPKHVPEKEIRLLGMITSETGVPVFRVLHFSEHQTRPGGPTDVSHPWALLTRLPGQPLSDIMDTLDDWEAESVGYEMGRYLGHIHQIPLDSFGGLFVPGPHDHVREKGCVLAQATQWLEECARDTLLPEQTLDALSQHFAETEILDRRQACLIHGSFSIENIMVERGATDYHVTGILDFTCAQGGSPELDMSRLFLWHFQDIPAFQKGFLDGYAESGELGVKFWERLALYKAFTCLGSLVLAHRRDQFQREQICKDQIIKYLDEYENRTV